MEACNRVSNTYMINIKQMKHKMSLIMNDINNGLKDHTSKSKIVLKCYIYSIEERELQLYIYANISFYNDIFLTLDRLGYDKNYIEDGIAIKNILLKLGTIRSICKKDI